MKFYLAVSAFISMVLASGAMAFETDAFDTGKGKLTIHFIGHGTLMFDWNGKIVHVDPWSRLADYDALPKADLVLITHAHRDHLDLSALGKIRGDKTVVIVAPAVGDAVEGGILLKNGDETTAAGVKIEAVPAYNLVHKRENGQPYHPKGEGDGYVLTFGGKRVYVAGDTENIPEMAQLQSIDIAFLPMNLPYTMTPEMAADAARMIKPRVLYPYHFSDTDPKRLTALLSDAPDIEVRIRNMK